MPTKREEELADIDRYRRLISDNLPQTTEAVKDHELHPDITEHAKQSELKSFRHAIKYLEANEDRAGGIDRDDHQPDDLFEVGEDGYKGVYEHREGWVAGLWVGPRWKTFGPYDTKPEAAKAWNEAIRIYWGKFSGLNDIPEHINSIPKMSKT